MMRHLAVLAVIGLAGGAQASSWTDSLFSERTHDFGSVARGPTLYHTFVITNRTSEVLSLAPLRIPCGCVKATLAKSTLASGESTTIDACLSTAGFVGLVQKRIHVTFVQPRVEEVALSLQATVHDAVTLTPSSVDFGQVRFGEPAEATVFVRFRQPGEYRLLSVKAESTFLQVRSQLSKRDTLGEATQVTVSVQPDLPPGRWHSAVWASTNHPAMPLLRIPVTITCEPGLRASSVSFGSVKAGVVVTRRFVVNGQEPFRIIRVTGASETVTIPEWASEQRKVHVLTVRLNPVAPGPIAVSIRVVTDRPGTQTIDIPVTATVLP